MKLQHLSQIFLAATTLSSFQTALAQEEPGACRWLFGAKYVDGMADMAQVVNSAKTLIQSCPTYESAGYGLAIPGMSSYYDIALFVDSKDCNATAMQAGCMVESLNTNPSLASNLTTGLYDASEISIAISKEGDYKMETNDMVHSHFVRFKDMGQRKWLSQRADAFLKMSPVVGDFDVTDIQSSVSQFPESFLSAWPNDVHFAAMLNFGGTLEPFRNLASFSMYAVNHQSEAGNQFLPGPSELAYERHSITFQAEMIN